jgi:hypothetical protein
MGAPGLISLDHPDPSWARVAWESLDGSWDITKGRRKAKIKVPFPVGSSASGVGFRPWGRFVYSRSFFYSAPRRSADRQTDEERVWLAVGACDHEVLLKVNGQTLGRHVGGYSSFVFEISDFVRDGENTLCLEVKDSLALAQIRGKQSFLPFPFAVWYPGYAGIWQSVWLEFTGPCRMERPRIDIDWVEGRVDFCVEARARSTEDLLERAADTLGAEIQFPDGRRKSLALARHGELKRRDGGSLGVEYKLSVGLEDLGGFLWSCENPNLYRITCTLEDRGGASIDLVRGYFGLRRIEARDGAIFLNGTAVALRMALIQGYYPEGGYCPLSVETIEGDLAALKAMGYNGARIHQKIESPRFLALCDLHGIMVTEEMPSFYRPSSIVFSQYEKEFAEIVDRDRNHPCIIAWVLFNETWGIWGIYKAGSPTRRFVQKMIGLARKIDPCRLVIDNSGWEHLDTDIADLHHYLGTAQGAVEWYDALAKGEGKARKGVSFLKTLEFYAGSGISRFTKALFLDGEAEARALGRKTPWMLSEYGGFGWYQVSLGGSVEERIERYTLDAAKAGIFMGYCFTQLYDVGAETNGLLDFQRNAKVDARYIESINLAAAAIIEGSVGRKPENQAR